MKASTRRDLTLTWCESFLRARGFAAVPQDGFAHVASAAVVQQARMTIHDLLQADAPQRRGAPLAAAGIEVGTVVSQLRSMSCSSKS